MSYVYCKVISANLRKNYFSKKINVSTYDYTYRTDKIMMSLISSVFIQMRLRSKS